MTGLENITIGDIVRTDGDYFEVHDVIFGCANQPFAVLVTPLGSEVDSTTAHTVPVGLIDNVYFNTKADRGEISND